MSITDSIQANLGPLFVSSMIILLQMMFIYLLCHLHELTDTLGLLLGVSTVFEIFKGGISWNHISKSSTGAREMCLLLNDFPDHDH